MGVIRTARVSVTDPEARTFDARLEYGNQTLRGVRLKRGVEVPGADMLVLICKPDDGTDEWFHLVTASEGEPVLLGEDDQGFIRPDGARVVLRANGVLELCASPLAGVFILPLEQLVRINAVKYKLVSPHGSMIWEPSVFAVSLGEAGGDTGEIQLTLGGSSTAFGASTWAEGKAVRCGLKIGGAFHTEIAQDGSLSLVCHKLGLRTTGDVAFETEGNIGAKTKNLTLAGDQYAIALGRLDVTVQTSMSLICPELVIEGVVRFGKTAINPLPDGVALLKWMMEDAKLPLPPDALWAYILKVLKYQVRV